MPPNAERAATRGAGSSSVRSAPYPRPEDRPSRKNTHDSEPDSGSETQAGGSSTGPRTTRQQYSACGACRMRRVKCNLKDVLVDNTAAKRPSCSNCQERGLNCIDEYESGQKPGKQKLLRRGRRIQNAEVMFGKINDPDGMGEPSCIPSLAIEFFSSAFWFRFHVQRPLIEPLEFIPRYQAYLAGEGQALGPDGLLIAKALVVWAACVGLDEAGNEWIDSNSPLTLSPPNDPLGTRRAEWTNRVHLMLRELMRYLDVHSLLRKPSWDSVRGLLLLLPLILDGPFEQLERLALTEAVHSHIYTLCSLGGPVKLPMVVDQYVATLVRARIFWYAYVREGVTSGLRGGRLVITDDDLESFQSTLPRSQPHQHAHPTPQSNFEDAKHLSSIVIGISAACRMAHAVLTGPRVRTRMINSHLDAQTLESAWEYLDRAWGQLDGLRQARHSNELAQDEEADRFASSWQLYIFEAHNVMREALKQRLIALRDPMYANLPNLRAVIEQVDSLHQRSLQRCNTALGAVVLIIRSHVVPELGSPFFAFDASLIRDGCYFAGLLLSLSETGQTDHELRSDIDMCIHAIRSMRYALGGQRGQEATIDRAWNRRMQRTYSRPAGQQPAPLITTTTTFLTPRDAELTMAVPHFREVPPTLDPVWDAPAPHRPLTIAIQPVEHQHLQQQQQLSARSGYASVPITPTNFTFSAAGYQAAPHGAQGAYSTPPGSGSNNSRPSTSDGPTSSLDPAHLMSYPSATSELDNGFGFTYTPSALSSEHRSLSAPSVGVSPSQQPMLPMMTGMGASYANIAGPHAAVYSDWQYAHLPATGH